MTLRLLYLLTKRNLLMECTVLLAVGNSSFVGLCGQSSSTGHIMVCESTTDACDQPTAHLDVVWAFDGTEGRVKSPAEQAGVRLTIDRFDSNSIVVRRVDISGPTAGLTALYTGAVRGSDIGGTVQWSWPDHPGYPTKGSFSAMLQDQVPAGDMSNGATNSKALPPSELLVCENDGPCNAAWSFNGSTGTGTWFSRKATQAALTVVRYDPGYILVRRTDKTDGISANYAGSLQGDHYSGTIVWSTPGHPGEATGSWTATIPQTGCNTQTGLEAADAMRIGQYALMFKRDHDAFDCYIVAAKAGDAIAQAAVGLLYYQGRGAISQNYAEAFLWLHKAADQNVYAAERTVAEMYTAGLGTPQDSTLAAIYAARADEQKHDMERRQELEERAIARREEHAERSADRATQLLSSFVLGASFGLFF